MRGAPTLAAAALLLAATGCSNDGDTDTGTASSGGATGDARVFPGGDQLSTYQGDATYPWRVNVLDNQDALLESMRKVSGDLDESDLDDLVLICVDLADGVEGTDLIGRTITRFSSDADRQLQASDAASLIVYAQEYACP